MQVDSKNKVNKKSSIYELYEFLLSVKDDSMFYYNGLKVEIDPTFDFVDDNVLVRWVDVEEGFNDKILLTNPAEFQTNFEIIYD